jgi:hypothetical protein
MLEPKTIKALDSKGDFYEFLVEVSGPKPWEIRYQDHDGRLRSFPSTDVFKALQGLRLELERDGVRLLCAGARRDVWPSGMARDMGGGRKAYIMRLGRQAARADLVDIFEYAEPSLVGTVLEQHEYFRAWLDSVRA